MKNVTKVLHDFIHNKQIHITLLFSGIQNTSKTKRKFLGMSTVFPVVGGVEDTIEKGQIFCANYILFLSIFNLSQDYINEHIHVIGKKYTSRLLR